MPTLTLTLRITSPLSLEHPPSTFDLGSREVPFITKIFFVGGIRILLDYKERELSLLYSLSQRDISLSRWQRDDENFLLGVYPLPGLLVNLLFLYRA